jgi:hypothetical protein
MSNFTFGVPLDLLHCLIHLHCENVAFAYHFFLIKSLKVCLSHMKTHKLKRLTFKERIDSQNVSPTHSKIQHWEELKMKENHSRKP